MREHLYDLSIKDIIAASHIDTHHRSLRCYLIERMLRKDISRISPGNNSKPAKAHSIQFDSTQ